MAAYGVLLLGVGLGLIGGAAGIVTGLHRRTGAPYALLSVGVITYVLSLLVQVIALQVMDRALLGILSLRALALGVTAGFSEETARLLGYQYLARGAETRAHALMIGAGHGLVEAFYTALVALSAGLSLVGASTAHPDDPLALTSGAAAEAVNGLLPVIMHMALSWLVLQVFLRGALAWLFLAVFFHAACEMMAALLGPGDLWIVAGWRAVVALISLAVIIRLRAPQTGEEAAHQS